MLAIPALFSILSFAPETKSAAVPFNDQQSFDISTTLFNPCTGELIDFEGQGHISVHGVMNNNKFSFHSHFNTQGIHGVGQTSGLTYTGNEADNYSVNGSLTNPTLVITETQSFKMITAGGGNNFVVKALFHVTVTPNGDVTTLVDNFSIECQ